MVIETWFPLALYLEDLPEAASHQQALYQAVLDLEAQSGERKAYPGMAWTGDLHQVAQIHQDVRFKWIVAQIESHTLLYLQDLGLNLSQLQLYIQRSWPVVARHGQGVGAHCHHTAHISAVYYVAVPTSTDLDPGHLLIHNESRFNEVCPGLGSENTGVILDWNDLNQLQVAYPPVAGRLVIFPAKQRHEVTMNESKELRVSLSFDIVITASVKGSIHSYEFLTPPLSHWQPFRSQSPDIATDGDRVTN